MKRISLLVAILLAFASALPAHAHGYGHGREAYRDRGYSQGDYGYRWVRPWVGAAIVGGAAYAVMPPIRYVQPTPVPRTAYFCAASQQFYPNVPTCTVPWQVVTY